MHEQISPQLPGRGLIEGPAGVLEVLVEHPKQRRREGCVVIAHPHPLYGGTLDNKVVYMLARGVLDAGVPAVRFNFRGVGRSAGTHADGVGEQEDLRAVVEFVRADDPADACALAGFSFGSYVALAQCAPLAARGVLTIAPPLGYVGTDTLPDAQAPWWMIHGTADEVVDYADSVQRAQAAPRPPEVLETADGVGHFFHGELAQIRDIAQRFTEAVLRPTED